MLFGDPRVFGIEAVLEPGPEFGPVDNNLIAGRIRIWMSDVAVGNFEEPLCYFRGIEAHLAETAVALEGYWDTTFDGLEPDAIFDRLDYLTFAAHRHQCLDLLPNWDEVAYLSATRSFGNKDFSFLTNVSEAFDGWKVFLTRPPGDELLAIVLPESSDIILSFHFPVYAFRQAVWNFSDWVREQELLLLISPG